MEIIPKMHGAEPWQSDAGRIRRLVPGMLRAITGLAAHGLNIDPEAALKQRFDRFSGRNPLHLLASDARAIGLHLLVMDYDFRQHEVGELAGLSRKVVNDACMRALSMRDKPAQRQVIEKVETMLGIGT